MYTLPIDIGKGVPMSSDISVSNCAAWGSPTNSKNVQNIHCKYSLLLM